MGLTWFDGWTEPIPLNACSILEITLTRPCGDSWISEFPLLNKWKVEHVRNDLGSAVVILSFWDKNYWHEVYHEHTRGMDWVGIWSQMCATVKVCRDSMLP